VLGLEEEEAAALARGQEPERRRMMLRAKMGPAVEQPLHSRPRRGRRRAGGRLEKNLNIIMGGT
jgi:hypothetical protein